MTDSIVTEIHEVYNSFDDITDEEKELAHEALVIWSEKIFPELLDRAEAFRQYGRFTELLPHIEVRGLFDHLDFMEQFEKPCGIIEMLEVFVHQFKERFW